MKIVVWEQLHDTLSVSQDSRRVRSPAIMAALALITEADRAAPVVTVTMAIAVNIQWVCTPLLCY